MLFSKRVLVLMAAFCSVTAVVQATCSKDEFRTTRDLGMCSSQQCQANDNQARIYAHSPREAPSKSVERNSYPSQQNRNRNPVKANRYTAPQQQSNNPARHQRQTCRSHVNKEVNMYNVPRPGRNVRAPLNCRNIRETARSPVVNHVHVDAPPSLANVVKLLIKAVDVSPADAEAGSRRRRYVEVLMNALDQYFPRRDVDPDINVGLSTIIEFLDGFSRARQATAATTESSVPTGIFDGAGDAVTSPMPQENQDLESLTPSSFTKEIPIEGRVARQSRRFKNRNRIGHRRGKRSVDMSRSADAFDSSTRHAARHGGGNTNQGVNRQPRNTCCFQSHDNGCLERNQRNLSPSGQRRNMAAVPSRRNVSPEKPVKRNVAPVQKNVKCNFKRNVNNLNEMRESRDVNYDQPKKKTSHRVDRQATTSPEPSYKLGDPRLTLRMFMVKLLKISETRAANGQPPLLSPRDKTQVQTCLAWQNASPQEILECVNAPYLRKKTELTEQDEFQPLVFGRLPKFVEIFQNFATLMKNAGRSVRMSEGIDVNDSFVGNGSDVRPTFESVLKIASKLLDIDPNGEEIETTVKNIFKLFNLVVRQVQVGRDDENHIDMTATLKESTRSQLDVAGLSEETRQSDVTPDSPQHLEELPEVVTLEAPRAEGTTRADFNPPLPTSLQMPPFDFWWWARPTFWLSLDL